MKHSEHAVTIDITGTVDGKDGGIDGEPWQRQRPPKLTHMILAKEMEDEHETGTQLAATKASNEMIHNNLCFFTSLFFRVTI